MDRRLLLQAALVTALAGTLSSGCASQVEVTTPLSQALGTGSLSVQAIGDPGLVDLFKKRHRFAGWFEGLLEDELKSQGFTLADEDADHHLVVEVLRLASGSAIQSGANTKGSCRVRATLYDTWPGDQLLLIAEKQRKRRKEKRAKLPPPLLQFETTADVKARGRTDRRDLAKEATRKCAVTVAEYLGEQRTR